MSRHHKISFGKLKSIVFFGLIIGLGLGFLVLVRPFFYPLFWAAVLAVLFYPFHKFVSKHTGMPRLSGLIVVILTIALILLPLILLSVLLIDQSIQLFRLTSQSELFSSSSNVVEFIRQTPFASYAETIQANWSGYLQQTSQFVSKFIVEQIGPLTESSIRIVLLVALMLYALYYFIVDGTKLLKCLMYLSPLGDKYEAQLYQRFVSTAKATLKSTMLIGGLQGVLSGIIFFIVGIPGALVWSVIMFILSIIPAIGSGLVMIPAGLIMLVTGNIWQGVVLISASLVISLIDNVLRPPLIGKDTEMHPLVVLLATLGGIAVFGISGFIIGPIIAALFLSVLAIYQKYYKKQLSKN